MNPVSHPHSPPISGKMSRKGFLGMRTGIILQGMETGISKKNNARNQLVTGNKPAYE